jgi:septin family protein
MTDKTHDLFVQIDALLGKRSAEALTEPSVEVDDFPMLTEIIEVDEQMPASAHDPAERRQQDRRSVSRRKTDRVLLQEREYAALEQRMVRLFQAQEAQLEETIKQIIRAELNKILNS